MVLDILPMVQECRSCIILCCTILLSQTFHTTDCAIWHGIRDICVSKLFSTHETTSIHGGEFLLNKTRNCRSLNFNFQKNLHRAKPTCLRKTGINNSITKFSTFNQFTMYRTKISLRQWQSFIQLK